MNELDVVIDDMHKEKFKRTQVNEELLKEYVGGEVKINIFIYNFIVSTFG